MKSIRHADVLDMWNEGNRESRMTPDLGLVGSGGVEDRVVRGRGTFFKFY